MLNVGHTCSNSFAYIQNGRCFTLFGIIFWHILTYTAHPRHCYFACQNVQMVDVICPPLSISSIVVSLWLAGCLAKNTLIGWREYYGGGGVGVDRHLCGAQQTRGFDPMPFHYWPTANGAGPTLKQHWVKSTCLLGELSAFWYTRTVCVWLEQPAQCSV